MTKLLLEQIIRDESGQVLLRSRLRAVARRMGFSSAARERMELVCNEMTSNQIKFSAGTGVVQLWESAWPAAIDLFVLDYGPGIVDLPAASRDGYTTAGTMGKGLGAIKRLADNSAFYSQSARTSAATGWHGMSVWARFYQDRSVEPEAAPPARVGMYLRAYQDDRYNGDGLFVQSRGQRTRWLHLDGLGHGIAAAEVVHPLRQMLDMDVSLDELMGAISKRLRGGRGAVGLLGEVDAYAGTASLCGVGDMLAYHVNENARHEIALAPGILGHAHRRAELQTMTFPAWDMIITASDGIRRNWLISTFPGLWCLHPQMIALFLGQIVSRGNDDKSLFVICSPQLPEEE
ncbi:hypothetical protein BI364_13740 [Acidihalobacter yilgarnensis]|uniref:Uncharacterized protein n=1 Tax=Acidihalobacter yilgarnensis TaxID=2819280 RepID=A0A1D8IQW1_9GAMM|nr:SpoIIE family protein phosphatase [Acidihalobacter yilgarnensis]AOU98879.1 hypothetical protein BI364_13740 [Acidihalobacter yilgarnensis]